MSALILAVDRLTQTSRVSSAILLQVSLLANLRYWR